MYANMQALGWFWGSIRKMIQANPATTIREAIGEESVFQFGAQDCRKVFATKTNLIRDHAQDHLREKRNRSAILYRQRSQMVMIGVRQEVMAQGDE
jgi:hypothetical protein